MVTLQTLAVGVLLTLAFILGVISVISAYWYAKDIFTPTRKSVLISGIYLGLANLICISPLLLLVDYSSLFTVPTIFQVIKLVFAVLIFVGLILSPTIAYVTISYLYAMKIEKE